MFNMKFMKIMARLCGFDGRLQCCVMFMNMFMDMECHNCGFLVHAAREQVTWKSL